MGDDIREDAFELALEGDASKWTSSGSRRSEGGKSGEHRDMFVVPRITGEVDKEDDKEGEGDVEGVLTCSCFAVGLSLFLLLCTSVKDGDGVRLHKQSLREGCEVEEDDKDDGQPSPLDRLVLVLLGVLSTYEGQISVVVVVFRRTWPILLLDRLLSRL